MLEWMWAPPAWGQPWWADQDSWRALHRSPSAYGSHRLTTMSSPPLRSGRSAARLSRWGQITSVKMHKNPTDLTVCKSLATFLGEKNSQNNKSAGFYIVNLKMIHWRMKCTLHCKHRWKCLTSAPWLQWMLLIYNTNKTQSINHLI